MWYREFLLSRNGILARLMKSDEEKRTFNVYFSFHLHFGPLVNKFASGIAFNIAILRFNVREMDTFGWGFQIPIKKGINAS